MKTSLLITLSVTSILTFITSYFTGIVLPNAAQYISIVLVVLLDGFFGIWAGSIREGFKTFKALKIPKTVMFWIILLTVIISIEDAFIGIKWLSSTIVVPFLVFQIISILKNASKVGMIPEGTLLVLLSKIDKHKDDL